MAVGARTPAGRPPARPISETPRPDPGWIGLCRRVAPGTRRSRTPESPDPGLRLGLEEISSQGENSGRRHAVRRKRQAASLRLESAEPERLGPAAVGVDEQHATKARHIAASLDLELIVGVDRTPGSPRLSMARQTPDPGRHRHDPGLPHPRISISGCIFMASTRWSTTSPAASISVTSRGI